MKYISSKELADIIKGLPDCRKHPYYKIEVVVLPNVSNQLIATRPNECFSIYFIKTGGDWHLQLKE